MENYELKNIGVLGAGLMGHGLAQVFAVAGYKVNLYDENAHVLDSAKEKVRKNLDTFVDLNMISAEQVAVALDRITLCRDLESLCAERDFIIEAISENLDLKRKVFAALEKEVASSVILASNTSAISIGKIADGLSHPQRVLGTHFWNPPHVVPCVEVIKAPYTSSEVLESVFRLLAKAGKRPVKVMKDVPGFVGNRMQHALWREAIDIVAQGVASAKGRGRCGQVQFRAAPRVLGSFADRGPGRP